MRWLYKTTTLELKSNGFEKAMNEFLADMGKEEWELVNTIAPWAEVAP